MHVSSERTLECAPAMFTACVFVCVHIRLCMFVLDAESVEWETESSASHLAAVLIGCALLTGCWQSTSHTQVLCFSQFHLRGLWNYFLWGIPCSTHFQAWKRTLSGALWQVTKLVFLPFGCRKGEGEAASLNEMLLCFLSGQAGLLLGNLLGFCLCVCICVCVGACVWTNIRTHMQLTATL